MMALVYLRTEGREGEEKKEERKEKDEGVGEEDDD